MSSSNESIGVRSGSLQLKLILLSILVAMVPLFFVSRALFVALAQTSDEVQKQIVRVNYPNEPLQIVGLRNSQKALTINEKFRQERDWLQGLTVRFKNNTGKAITYLAWSLDFPETQASGPLMVFDVFYGAHPIRQAKEYKDEPPIAAGELFEQHLDGKRVDQISNFIGKRHRLDTLTRVNIRILEIRYDDGTGWNSGTFTKEDLHNPGRFIPVKPV